MPDTVKIQEDVMGPNNKPYWAKEEPITAESDRSTLFWWPQAGVLKITLHPFRDPHTGREYPKRSFTLNTRQRYTPDERRKAADIMTAVAAALAWSTERAPAGLAADGRY